MSSQSQKLHTPEENYEAARLELAIYRIMKRDHDAVKAAMSEEDEKSLSRIAEEKMPHMLNFIDKHMKHMATYANLWKFGRRILQTAAIIVLILNVGLTTAVATSGSVRAKVIRFLMEMNDSYMSIGFSQNGEEIIVPEAWEGRYYPTYIPQGYFVQRYLSQAGTNWVEYSNAQGDVITIEVCDTNSFGRLNVENTQIDSIQLQAVEATVLQQPSGEFCIIWSLGDCYFIVSGYDYDVVLAVAKSMEIIQK